MEPAEPAAPAPDPARDRRGDRRPRDMVLSLAVLLVPIALLLGFYRLVLNGDAPVTVDARPTIQEAQQAGAFPVAAPAGPGDGWHVSSASFRHESGGATLRIGYVDPDGEGLQLIESSVPADTLLPAELGSAAKPLDTYRMDARVWRLYDARPGERALVLAEPGRTIIVVGTARTNRLEELASSLS